MSTPAPSSTPSDHQLADIFAVYAAALSPDWFRRWYDEHEQSGGGGIFSPSLTLWLMLTQHLLGGSSLEAVLPELRSPRARQLSPKSRRLAQQKVSSHNSGYCYARHQVPGAAMQAACAHLNQQIRPQMPWPEQPVYLIDGSSLQLAASAALRQLYPPATGSKGDGHWPLLRLVVIHELHTGLAATPPAWGALNGPSAVSEQGLARQLLPQLPTPGTVLGDRNFGVFQVVWDAHKQGHHVLFRLTEQRAHALAPTLALDQDGEQEVVWRPSRADRRTQPDWPADAAVAGRLIVHHVETGTGKGRQPVLVFTTRRDLSAAEVVEYWYPGRWHIETDLRSVKHAVGLESRGAQSPDVLAKDLHAALTAYNLLRLVGARAAARRGLEPRRISFTRTVVFVRATAPVLASLSESERVRRWEQMLDDIALRPLPVRKKARHYPREVWPRRRRYPLRPAPPETVPARKSK